jgi:outer membrane receptor for ferrienterochelin and colicin
MADYKKSLRYGVAAYALILAGSMPALAQTVVQHAEDGADVLVAPSPAVQELDAMVVSASAAEVSERDAPASISVITREEIAKRPVKDLNQILRDAPGVNMDFGSDGTKGVSIRGLGDGYTLILIDGKRVNSQLTFMRHYRGDTNWVPVEAIERVEVVRGPMSTLYGSDALGGVVNIITRKSQKEWHGSVTAETIVPDDSNEGASRKVTFYTSGSVIPDLLRAKVYGGYTENDSDNLGRDSGSAGTKNRDISATFTLTPTDDQELDLELSYGRQRYLAFADEEDGGETKMTRYSAALGHKGYWDFGTTNFRIFTEQAVRSNQFTDRSGAVLGDEVTAKSYTAEGKVSLPLELGLPQMLNIGGEYRLEKLKDPLNMGKSNTVLGGVGSDTADMTTYALFLEDNISVTDDLTLTGGLRMDHHEEFGTHYSPRAYVNYNLTDAVTLKAGYAEAFKAPDIRQLNPYWVSRSRGRGCGAVGGPCEMVGNPDLKPETSQSAEFGVYYDAKGWKANATYFHNDIENKITSARTASLILGDGTKYVQQVNVDKARTSGIEGSFTVPVLKDTLTWTNNFTYLIEAKNLETGEPLSTSPKLSVRSNLNWRATQDLSFDLSARYMGKQVDYVAETETLSAQVVKAYTTFSLSTAYEANDHIVLRGGVENILDEQTDSEGYNYREEGRRFFLSATAKF